MYFFKKKYRAESITSYARQLKRRWTNNDYNMNSLKSPSLGPFIRGKIRRVLHKTRTLRINGTFRLK